MYREGAPGKPAPGNPCLESPRSVTLARQRWFGSAGLANSRRRLAAAACLAPRTQTQESTSSAVWTT
ncbi:hypothetical protein R3O65_07570 [Corynebacterium pseudodiphtheriticum]|uniref:hypothetical protein n=1 Tax=Corynebacterium pseudodiphtheriticum TaxID=37637 RepID=UPI002542BB3B|nr:hypothetical protein [Corynebacterium pseudodiphtheriticum]MDK4277474.1 hypothetical protein [Corynebacterium pseudodiphtheriticum]